jgi:hypothetical protein
MKITASVFLTSEGVFSSHTGKLFKAGPMDTESLYNVMQLDYPRFFKMDKLSQVAFLIVEDLVSKNALDSNCGIQIWNQHSSYTADMKHLINIEQGGGGPANFTYTLPNIMLGELSIRFNLHSESVVFITNTPPDFKLMEETLHLYLNDTKEQRILAGWIDVSEVASGFMCDIRQSEHETDNLADEFKKLYECIIL